MATYIASTVRLGQGFQSRSPRNDIFVASYLIPKNNVSAARYTDIELYRALEANVASVL